MVAVVLTYSAITTVPSNGNWNCTEVDLSDVLRPACQLPARYFNPVQLEQWRKEQDDLFWTTPGAQCPMLSHGSHDVTASIFYDEDGVQNNDKTQQLMPHAPFVASAMALSETSNTLQCPMQPQDNKSVSRGELGVQHNDKAKQPMPPVAGDGFCGIVSWNDPTGHCLKFRTDNGATARVAYVCPCAVPLLLEPTPSCARDAVVDVPGNEPGMSYTWNALLGLVCMSAVARLVCEIPRNSSTHAFKMFVTAIVVVPALACVAMHWALLLLWMPNMNLTAVTGLISLCLVVFACFKTARDVIQDVPVNHAARVNSNAPAAGNPPGPGTAGMKTRSARTRAQPDTPQGPIAS